MKKIQVLHFLYGVFFQRKINKRNSSLLIRKVIEFDACCNAQQHCKWCFKGGFVPKVQTSRKKFEQKVRAYKNWIYDNRNRPMREIIKELNVKLR